MICTIEKNKRPNLIMTLTKEQALEVLLNAHSLSDDDEVWLVDDSTQTEDTITLTDGPVYNFTKVVDLSKFSVSDKGDLVYEGSYGPRTYTVLARANVYSMLKGF